MKFNYLVASMLAIFASVYVLFITSGKENKPVPVEKTFVLNGGTYGTETHVIITQDTKKALEFVRERVQMTLDSTDFDASGVTFSDDGGNMVIWLDNAEDPGVISHELLHATFFTMLWAGIPFNDTTEESFAYQLQYLTNQFYNKLK